MNIGSNLNALADVLRSMPDAAADALDGWLMRAHHQAWNDEPGAPCSVCRDAVWPCEPYMAAVDRRVARRHRPKDAR